MLIALLTGGVCLCLGMWATRRVGLLGSTAPLGETIGVGLGAGLLIAAAVWAAIGSGGRSAFTPVAIALIASVAAGNRRLQLGARSRPTGDRRSAPASRVGVAILAVAFVVFVGLIYGSTQAPSPRNGEQPVEFTDVGYYSALAINLDRTGTESTTYPSGFDSIDGMPAQAWYHWGEIWIAAATLRVFDLDPVLARNYVVLPLILLAYAALAGTLVRRVARTRSRAAFLFGAAASLLLAPATVDSDVFFAHWAVGNLSGINLYGLALVVVLLAVHVMVVGTRRQTSWAFAWFAGTVIASLLPAHIVLAILATVGAAGVALLGTIRLLLGRRPFGAGSSLQRIAATAVVVTVSTIVWGAFTGHGVNGSAPSTLIMPFNQAWASAVVQTVALSGVLLAVPLAWLAGRSMTGPAPALFAWASIVVVAGAIGWGSRVADYNAFHLFFGAIAAVVTPIAAVAVWMLLTRMRSANRHRLATGLLVVAIVQIELGVSPTMIRLEGVKPSGYDPIPVAILEAIERLPADARLAYACRPDEEFHFADPRLASINAHTGRRVVPMCFEEDGLSALNGARSHVGVENPAFKWAPQRVLYPDPSSYPSPERVDAFLHRYGIDYIYADEQHPNVLKPDAVSIIAAGNVTILKIR